MAQFLSQIKNDIVKTPSNLHQDKKQELLFLHEENNQKKGYAFVYKTHNTTTANVPAQSSENVTLDNS